jgi:hypothetical protein
MLESPDSKVVVLPFPFEPRTIQFGDLAKVLDFVAWKDSHMPKTNGEANGNGEANAKPGKSKEELEQMSAAEKKLYVLSRLFEVLKEANEEDVQTILDVLDKTNRNT